MTLAALALEVVLGLQLVDVVVPAGEVVALDCRELFSCGHEPAPSWAGVFAAANDDYEPIEH